MQQRNCAFLTLKDRSDFYIYDHLLFEPLAKLGWNVEEIPWTDKNIDWKQYEAVIIRSTWDYQNQPDHFLATLEQIEKATTLYNPVDICRWNLNKRYLFDLEKKGVPIVPTSLINGLDKKTIESMFQQTNQKRLIAKPLVGANADDTFVLKENQSDSWAKAINIFIKSEVMVQPFIDSVQTDGEYSLFYFGGKLSHAILKRPAKDDFRVQEEHGGAIRAVPPPEDIMAAGNQAMKALNTTLLYARVDFVRLNSGQPVLMEMELIEPSLYFEQDPSSVELFAAQFKKMIDG